MRIPTTRGARALLVALLLLASAYAAQLLRNTCYFASGPDSTGYLNEAKLFASGQVRVVVEPLRELRVERSMIDVFVPLGFAVGPRDTMVPTYPPGLPVHMIVFGWIGGWDVAPFLVPPFAAIGCLLLMYALAREMGLPRSWSLVAPMLLAPVAVFLFYAMQPMTDVLATFWILLAMWCGLRGRRNVNLLYVAGAAFAIAVAVRPTNALAAVPFVFAVPFELRAWRNVIAGALLPAVALLWLNATLYDSPFRFGFASVADVLTWRPPGVCSGFHLWWTMRMLTPLGVAIAIVAPFLRGIAMRYRLMLGSWFVVFFAFYSFYNYCPNWTAVRFLLPTFPAVIFALLLVLQCATQGRGRWVRIVACSLVLLVLAGEMDLTSYFRVFRVDDHESVFPETVQWTRRMVPANALVVSGVFSGAFFCDGRWTVRWDRLDADRFSLLRAYAGSANRVWYAVISDGEVSREEFLRRLPGVWTPVGRNRDVTLYRLDS